MASVRVDRVDFRTSGVRRPGVTLAGVLLIALQVFCAATLIRTVVVGDTAGGWFNRFPNELRPMLILALAVLALAVAVVSVVAIMNLLGAGPLLCVTKIAAPTVRVEFSQAADLKRRLSVDQPIGAKVSAVVVRERRAAGTIRTALDRVELRFSDETLTNRTFRLFTDPDIAALGDFLASAGFDADVSVVTELN